MWGCVLLVLGSAVVGEVSAVDTATLTTRSTYDINYRQVDTAIPLPVPSNVNSEPYPPGVPATHATPPPPPQVTNPPPPTLVFSFISSSPSNPAAQIPFSSPTPSPTPTPAPTTSQISISALPPRSSSDLPNAVSHPKKRLETDQKFKLIYLAPVFALLGILWGSLTAWFAYGCMTRRPKVIEVDSAVGGPRYVPAESDDMDGQRDAEEGRLMRENEKAEEVFRWPGGNEKPAAAQREAEDDPFLVPPPVHQGRTSKSTRSTRTAVSAYSDAVSMDLYESEGEGRRREDEVPWESLRHKSIKRGILEQVKKEGSWIDSLRGITGSSFSRAGREGEGEEDVKIIGGGTGSARRGNGVGRRMRHTRTDSDLLVQDVDLKAPDRVTLKSQRSDSSGGYSTQPPTRTNSAQTPVRAYSSQTVHSEGAGDDTRWVNGGGFRIVEESPLPTPKEPEVSRSRFGSGWWWGSGADVDRYTPVPPRPGRSRSRSSSPVKGARGGDGDGNTQHRHAGVLPQSPPQIMSPPLESQLCFTPTPASRARMATTSSPAAKRRKDDNRTTPTKSSGQTRGRRLISPKVPPLPFPSAPDRGVNSPRPDIYRARLVKPASASKTRPPPTSANPSASDQDAEIASVALKKVEEIIGQSWSTRDLSEEGVRSLSPTGFGRRL